MATVKQFFQLQFFDSVKLLKPNLFSDDFLTQLQIFVKSSIMDLIGCKVLVLVLLGLIKLISGLSPLLLVKYLKNQGMIWVEHFMAGLICIGGGVLLSTVFIHMLPEVNSVKRYFQILIYSNS